MFDPRRLRRLKEEVVDELLDLFSQGFSTVEISIKLGISQSSVVKYSSRHQVTRPEGWTPINAQKVTIKKKQQIIQRRVCEFKPHGNVGLIKTFELDCWNLIRLNNLYGTRSLIGASDRKDDKTPE